MNSMTDLAQGTMELWSPGQKAFAFARCTIAAQGEHTAAHVTMRQAVLAVLPQERSAAEPAAVGVLPGAQLAGLRMQLMLTGRLPLPTGEHGCQSSLAPLPSLQGTSCIRLSATPGSTCARCLLLASPLSRWRPQRTARLTPPMPGLAAGPPRQPPTQMMQALRRAGWHGAAALRACAERARRSAGCCRGEPRPGAVRCHRAHRRVKCRCVVFAQCCGAWYPLTSRRFDAGHAHPHVCQQPPSCAACKQRGLDARRAGPAAAGSGHAQGEHHAAAVDPS